MEATAREKEPGEGPQKFREFRFAQGPYLAVECIRYAHTTADHAAAFVRTVVTLITNSHHSAWPVIHKLEMRLIKE